MARGKTHCIIPSRSWKAADSLAAWHRGHEAFSQLNSPLPACWPDPRPLLEQGFPLPASGSTCEPAVLLHGDRGKGWEMRERSTACAPHRSIQLCWAGPLSIPNPPHLSALRSLYLTHDPAREGDPFGAVHGCHHCRGETPESVPISGVLPQVLPGIFPVLQWQRAVCFPQQDPPGSIINSSGCSGISDSSKDAGASPQALELTPVSINLPQR